MRIHIPFISLALLCIYLLVLWKIIIDQQHYLFIDHLNIIFHEAGHFAFFFFGSFLHTLGGTLMQLLIRVSISIYFFY
ncbi:hypothetical protein KC573_03130, partial [candidate division WWE3 bacterium]|nr:hypothetical protein [candidate division WWE3 bacterium]